MASRTELDLATTNLRAGRNLTPSLSFWAARPLADPIVASIACTTCVSGLV